MLYGVEINEPHQLHSEYKYRCQVQVSDEGDFSWTSKPERQFVTESEETAQAVADTLAASWDAKVVPLEEGRECPLSDAEVVKAFRAREKERVHQFRQIR